MAQEEAEIERGIAGVGALEIQEDQTARVDQDILGAEVAQDQRAMGLWHRFHRGDHRLDPRRDRRVGTGDRPVIGINPQLIEQGGVGQGLAEDGVTGGVGMDGTQERPQSCGDLRIDAAVHQVGLPGRRVIRCAGHREQILGPILEEDLGNSAGRKYRGQQRRARRARPRCGRAARATPWPPADVRGTA